MRSALLRPTLSLADSSAAIAADAPAVARPSFAIDGEV
jgi:hypothetical protein